MFVIPCYQWMLAPFEAADSRIQTLLTFVATVTFAIPTVSRALRPDLSLRSGWFIAAMALASLVTVVGVTARPRGRIVLPSPLRLWEKSLALNAGSFQRDALYSPGQHYEKNRVAINSKATAAAIMAGLFLGELGLLFAWSLTLALKRIP